MIRCIPALPLRVSMQNCEPQQEQKCKSNVLPQGNKQLRWANCPKIARSILLYSIKHIILCQKQRTLLIKRKLSSPLRTALISSSRDQTRICLQGSANTFSYLLLLRCKQNPYPLGYKNVRNNNKYFMVMVITRQVNLRDDNWCQLPV